MNRIKHYVCVHPWPLDYFKRRISIDTVKYATNSCYDNRDEHSTNKEILLVNYQQIFTRRDFPNEICFVAHMRSDAALKPNKNGNAFGSAAGIFNFRSNFIRQNVQE
jgi:hypothetical protein